MKPEREAYEILIERLKEEDVSSDEMIFIDDKKRNLIPAKEFGIKTILFNDVEQLEKELIKFGVNAG